MRKFWSMSWDKWGETARAIKNGLLKEQAWYEVYNKHPPMIHSLEGRSNFKNRISFTEDKWRRWYYNRYPKERYTWSATRLKASAGLGKTPIDKFVDKQRELVEMKWNERDAFNYLVKQRQFEEEAAMLEIGIAREQAVAYFGAHEYNWVDGVAERDYEMQKSYIRAKANILRDKRERLSAVIKMKDDTDDYSKIMLSECFEMKRSEVITFIKEHPQWAKFFDDTVFWGVTYKKPAKLTKGDEVEIAPYLLAEEGVSRIVSKGQKQVDVKSLSSKALYDLEEATENAIIRLTRDLGDELTKTGLNLDRDGIVNLVTKQIQKDFKAYKGASRSANFELPEDIIQFLSSKSSPKQTDKAKQAIDNLFDDFTKKTSSASADAKKNMVL